MNILFQQILYYVKICALMSITIICFGIIIYFFKKFEICSKIKNWSSIELKKIILRNKTRWQEFLNLLFYLHEHNLLLIVWYFIVFTLVFLSCLICWHNFSDIDWKMPRKEVILFIWLIILSIIPFGNCQLLGFKFDSNGTLNNKNATEIPKSEIKNRNKLIDELKEELNTLEKNNGGKNV